MSEHSKWIDAHRSCCAEDQESIKTRKKLLSPRGFIKLLLTKYYIKRKKWYLINSQLLFFSFSNNWKTRLIVLRDLEQYFVLVAVTVGIRIRRWHGLKNRGNSRTKPVSDVLLTISRGQGWAKFCEHVMLTGRGNWFTGWVSYRLEPYNALMS